MVQLQLANITLILGAKRIFENLNWEIQTGQKIGFIGANGAPDISIEPLNTTVMPWIQELYPCCLKVSDVACDYGHAMYQRRGSYQGIAVGTGVGHVQFGATLCDQHIDRENPPRKCKQDMAFEPSPQQCSLCAIAPLYQLNADF